MPDPGGTSAAPAPALTPDLGRSLRFAVTAYIDEIVVFLLAGIGWVLAVSLLVAVATVVPIAVVLAPLLALPTSALMRLAIVAARDGTPTLATGLTELGRSAGRKILLAALQLLIIGFALSNLVIVGDMSGLIAVLSALVSAYAILAVGLTALTVWPIVCDPSRDGPLGTQLRLGLAAVVARPLPLIVLLLVTGLALAVSVQLVVPAIILPAMVLLAIARYVVPLVDRLRPVEAP